MSYYSDNCVIIEVIQSHPTERDRMQSAKPIRTKASNLIAAIILVAAIVLLGTIFARSTSAQTPDSSQPFGGGTPTPTPVVCEPIWNVYVSPNVGNGTNILKDVAVADTNDVWAVGYYDMGGGVYRTMAQH